LIDWPTSASLEQNVRWAVYQGGHFWIRPWFLHQHCHHWPTGVGSRPASCMNLSGQRYPKRPRSTGSFSRKWKEGCVKKCKCKKARPSTPLCACNEECSQNWTRTLKMKILNSSRQWTVNLSAYWIMQLKLYELIIMIIKCSSAWYIWNTLDYSGKSKPCN